MNRILIATLLAATASIVSAHPGARDEAAGPAMPAAKRQLMKPPANARHYTISSVAGKHGNILSWTAQTAAPPIACRCRCAGG